MTFDERKYSNCRRNEQNLDEEMLRVVHKSNQVCFIFRLKKQIFVFLLLVNGSMIVLHYNNV